MEITNFSLVREASDPVRKGPPYEILVFLMNFIFFRQKEMILWGRRSTALFQTYNWEKSSFFQLAPTCICTDICKYVAGGPYMPPTTGKNRVNWRWQESGVVLEGRIEDLVQQEGC